MGYDSQPQHCVSLLIIIQKVNILLTNSQPALTLATMAKLPANVISSHKIR